MNRVYLFFATIIISVSIVSCTKDSFTRFNQEIDCVYENTEQAMIDFSVTTNLGQEKVKVGWEFGGSNTTNYTSTYHESYSEESDELTNTWIHYADKFILGVNDNQVTLRKYSIGDLELIIMPEMI